ncbi:DoxX family protein [Paenibacillus filicis]|uniref:DoxX family protein n=1 Tax=Paenibacillus filicis TaxID=669464 RepID=A0ABU9DG83_9BACL
MSWTVRILQFLIGVGFLLFGFMKVSGDPTQVEAFAEIYGYGTGFMYAVGAIEVLAAVGLLLGFWKKKLVPVFSSVLVVVMAGAILTHIRADQGFDVIVIPLVLLVLCMLLFLGHRKMRN